MDNFSLIGKEEKSYIGWNVIDLFELFLGEKKVEKIIEEIDIFIDKWFFIINEDEEVDLMLNLYIYLSYDFGESIMGIINNKEK